MVLIKLLSSLVLTLFLFSCASVDIAKVRDFPARDENCKLDTFSESAEIKRKYEVACILGSSTGTTLFADKSVQHAIDIAKPKACQCGADAILIENVTKTGMSLTGYGQGSASIKAIKYIDKK